MRISKIEYDPTKTVEQNAKANGVSIEGIRYYIKSMGIDRRYERKANFVEKIKDYLKKNPDATKNEVSEKLKLSINTVRQYWAVANGKEKLSDISRKRLPKKSFDELDIHPYVIWDIIHVEEFTTEIIEPFFDSDCPLSVVMRKCGKTPIKPDTDILENYKPKKKCDVVSVLPYTDDIHVVIKACLGICKNKVALLMPMRFLSGTDSFKGIIKKNPPVRIYQNISDVCRAKSVKTPKYSQSKAGEYVWCVWEKISKETKKDKEKENKKEQEIKTEYKWIENRQEPLYSTIDFDEVEILGGMKFKPNEWHKYPLGKCIQFHSKAEPENRVLSNHEDCIINFKGVEFYGVEQLFHALQFSESPEIIKGMMRQNSTLKSKSFCKEIGDLRNWDARANCYRHIALCHFYKYLSYKPYRDRLRETYPHDLVECPNGHDDQFGAVQKRDTNIFEGYNCSGRTTMVVRDLMIPLENKAVEKETKRKGRALSDKEREVVYEALYAQIRQKMDNNEAVIKDSQRILEIIEKYKIQKTKKRRPEYEAPPTKDTETKCLIIDFDNTLFDTSADDEIRKNPKGRRNWDKIYATIPQYRLYNGWREVFDWAKESNIQIGIISEASGELIEKTLEHFNLNCNSVVGYQPYYEKPNPLLFDWFTYNALGINLSKENIISIGSTMIDEEMSRAANVRFVGAVWDSKETEALKQRCNTIESPLEIIELFND